MEEYRDGLDAIRNGEAPSRQGTKSEAPRNQSGASSAASGTAPSTGRRRGEPPRASSRDEKGAAARTRNAGLHIGDNAHQSNVRCVEASDFHHGLTVSSVLIGC